MRHGWAALRAYKSILSCKLLQEKLRGRVYTSCVRGIIIYASETWKMTEEKIRKPKSHMLLRVTGITRKEALKAFHNEPLPLRLKKSRLLWYKHLEKIEPYQWPNLTRGFKIEDIRGTGRPTMT